MFKVTRNILVNLKYKVDFYTPQPTGLYKKRKMALKVQEIPREGATASA